MGQEAAKERAGLTSDGAATKAVEDGISMTIYVAAGHRSHLRSVSRSCWKTSVTIDRMLVSEEAQWANGFCNVPLFVSG